MSDDDRREQREKGTKPATSCRISPALLTVPSATTEDPAAPVATEDRHSRSSSPARLSTELTLKIATQIDRVAILKDILDSIPQKPTDTSLVELQCWIGQIDEVHKAFIKEHAYFEITWPAAFINHEYFATGIFRSEAQLHMKLKVLVSCLKVALSSDTSSQTSSQEDDYRCFTKLPDITIPTFSGDYSKWPPFRELFSSLILNNNRLSNIEKLHYLRGSMEGSPAQLIQGFPLSGDSLQASWDLLTSRYDNKRLLIQTHLDRLFSITTPTVRDAASFSKMISTVSETYKALHSLSVSQDMGNCIFVHHVSQHLDRATRELWETSLGASQTYPSFHQLEAFLISRARVLERIESTSTQPHSSSKPAAKTMIAQWESTQQTASATTSAYVCDCCNDSHFIVMCSRFRDLTSASRRMLAVEKWLCLGRHNVRSCKSTIECKICSAKHHTMLHEAKAASSTTQSRSTPSTS